MTDIDHFTVRDGEIIEAPRMRFGFLAGLSIGVFVIVVGVALAGIGGWL